MATIRKVLDLLTPGERQHAYLLVPLVVLMAGAQVAGIGSVAPFLSLMSNPDLARTNGTLGWLYQTLGFHSDRAFLIAAGVAVIVVLLVSNALLAGGYWVLYRFGSMRYHTISRRLLIRYLQQPYGFFLAKNSAALANNILQEVQQIVNGVVIPGLQAIASAVSALAIVVLLVVVNPWLAAMLIALLGGAYGLLYMGTRRYLGRIGRERVRANQARYQAANEAMGGIKELKVRGHEPEMVERFTRPSLRFARYQANSRIISAVPRFALEAIGFGGIVAIVLVLFSFGRGVAQIVPILGLYTFAGYRLLPAVQQVFAGVTQARYSSGALDEVHLMTRTVGATEADPEAFVDRDRLEPLPFRERVRFSDVSFRYPGTGDVLKGVSLDIPAGSSVAFAGTTGAGKSTLVDLLLGLLEPTDGVIEVDGTALDGDALPRWQMQVGYVPQSIFLTDDTVAHNIALGVPDDRIDMQAVRRAARIAQIDTFIETELARGYDTVVGERGVRLSGGQRQRLGLARALYYNPAVLVLDEATSALDGTTERRVYEAIESLPGGKTVIMIAHRLETIRNCDRIYLLERGEVVASGTFSELASANAGFRRMAEQGGTIPG